MCFDAVQELALFCSLVAVLALNSHLDLTTGDGDLLPYPCHRDRFSASFIPQQTSSGSTSICHFVVCLSVFLSVGLCLPWCHMSCRWDKRDFMQVLESRYSSTHRFIMQTNFECSALSIEKLVTISCPRSATGTLVTTFLDGYV